MKITINTQERTEEKEEETAPQKSVRVYVEFLENTSTKRTAEAKTNQKKCIENLMETTN